MPPGPEHQRLGSRRSSSGSSLRSSSKLTSLPRSRTIAAAKLPAILRSPQLSPSPNYTTSSSTAKMCFGSRDDMEAKRSREIDALIHRDEKIIQRQVKLLLLGEPTSLLRAPLGHATVG